MIDWRFYLGEILIILVSTLVIKIISGYENRFSEIDND